VADTSEFFEKYLPEKIASNPALATSVKAIFQFSITDAGTWTLDLSTPPGSVKEGPAENPGCTLTVAKAEWEKILDNPSYAMQAFMMGKIKVGGQVALAMQLQKILA
jgi:putative sterol carrier protein